MSATLQGGSRVWGLRDADTDSGFRFFIFLSSVFPYMLRLEPSGVEFRL